jgi:acyl-CoA reductase-like NAD-dependent aldehyde dehydrogenase
MGVTFIEPNRQDARLKIERRYQMTIGGRLASAQSGKTVKRESSVHPGLIVGEWPEASAADVELAILAARRAFDEGPWPKMSGKERAAILFRISEAIKANAEELALIESLEVGKTLAGARGEMNNCADLWHFAAGLVRGLEGSTHNALSEHALGIVLRDPIGVVGVVTPWNYPLVIASERLPWALGAGCTAVLKPSEFTSGSSLRLGQLALEAGLPEGVLNVVTGYGNPAGQTLAEHPGTDMIAFTGSQRVGRQIGGFAAPTIKRVGLELGGKGPVVVFADADLEAASQQVARSIFSNQGQTCIAGSRLIVERKVAEEFVERLQGLAGRVTVGDPLNPDTKVGAFINPMQLDKVEGYVKAGREAGAKVVVGGERVGTNGGLFYQPTIFMGVRPDMSIVRDEIFGPVLAVQQFDTREEAIRIANDTIYGLSAVVWSLNINNALQTIRGIRAGRCGINGQEGAAEMPIGGYKQSGQGRELGHKGFDEYSEFKNVHINMRVSPPWLPAA